MASERFTSSRSFLLGELPLQGLDLERQILLDRAAARLFRLERGHLPDDGFPRSAVELGRVRVVPDDGAPRGSAGYGDAASLQARGWRISAPGRTMTRPAGAAAPPAAKRATTQLSTAASHGPP